MIRKAKKSDDICKLALLIYEEIFISFSPCFKNRTEELWNILFTSETSKLSYHNILVYEYEDEIVGFICTYTNIQEKILQQSQIELMKKHFSFKFNLPYETFTNGRYIDSIAVCPNHRGKKIASKLINFYHEDLSLIVKKSNPAHKLYEKLEFKKIGDLTIFNQKYYQYKKTY